MKNIVGASSKHVRYFLRRFEIRLRNSRCSKTNFLLGTVEILTRNNKHEAMNDHAYSKDLRPLLPCELVWRREAKHIKKSPECNMQSFHFCKFTSEQNLSQWF